jgi:hypothetical protein
MHSPMIGTGPATVEPIMKQKLSTLAIAVSASSALVSSAVGHAKLSGGKSRTEPTR